MNICACAISLIWCLCFWKPPYCQSFAPRPSCVKNFSSASCLVPTLWTSARPTRSSWIPRHARWGPPVRRRRPEACPGLWHEWCQTRTTWTRSHQNSEIFLAKLHRLRGTQEKRGDSRESLSHTRLKDICIDFQVVRCKFGAVSRTMVSYSWCTLQIYGEKTARAIEGLSILHALSPRFVGRSFSTPVSN